VDRRISAHYTEQRREGGQPLEWRASPGFLRSMKRTAGKAPVYFLYGETDFLREELAYALSRLKLPRDRYEVDLLPGSIHTFRSLPVQRTTVDRIVRWFERRTEEVRSAG
jgi:acetyl esterase/lipase